MPISKDEKDNALVHEHGEKPQITVTGNKLGELHHHEIMQCLNMVDLKRGSNVAGHRGYFLKGPGVLLNQALINYGISVLTKKDYTPIQPPYFMKSSIMHKTCQLGDFSENLYEIKGNTDDGAMYMIATSEQPISALYSDEWIEPSDLPIKYCGVSSCFRKEAGSHGRDMWGIFRVHQFEKIE